MAHNIDMSNGRANVAFVNSPLWHNLGSQLTEDSSIEDWIETAGFNWDIIKTPVSYATGDGNMSVMDDKHVLYRSDTNAPLSVVGNDYKKKTRDMKNLMTFEKFSLFGKKKELSPDEEYKRQEKLHKEKEEELRKKSKSTKDFGEDDYTEKEEKRMVKNSNKMAKNTNKYKTE
jgi:hypothetical protein